MGPFTGEVVVSEHGNRFLRINLTDSKGTIKAKFYVGDYSMIVREFNGIQIYCAGLNRIKQD